MVIGLLILVSLLLIASATMNFGLFAALKVSHAQRLDYKERWQNANRLLQGADVDAVAEGKAVAPVQPASPPVPKGPGASVTGKTLAKGNVTLTQERLNKMSQADRYSLEGDRLANEYDPVDTLDGMSDSYVTAMIKRRINYGYD